MKLSIINIRSPFAALSLALVLAGCSLTTAYQRPIVPLPEQWGAAIAPQQPVSASTVLDWPAFVTDENLRRLIALTLANNRDLRQSLLNVEAARAQYRVQRAAHLPKIDAQSSGARQHLPADLSLSGQSETNTQWQAGIGLTAFELDLFGRVRNLSQAALQEYLATEENGRAVRISLITAVIQLYLSRDGAQQHHLMTAQTLQSRERALKLISQRRETGAATALDYQESLNLVQRAQADLERSDREVRLASNALGLLVGISDVATYLPHAPSANSVLVQNIIAGIPSELLTYRPDIQAAEHQLRARNASINAARAAFFPSISLTGLFGNSSTQLSSLFDGAQGAWSLTPQITLPIFSAGRNRANLELATVRRNVAIAEYEKTIQTAFKEASDALVTTATLQREEASLQKLAESGRKTLQLAQAHYRAGVDDHLRYLDAQRADYSNQIALIAVSTQRQLALATLFKTMGGTWRVEKLLNATEPSDS